MKFEIDLYKYEKLLRLEWANDNDVDVKFPISDSNVMTLYHHGISFAAARDLLLDVLYGDDFEDAFQLAEAASNSVDKKRGVV